ncbi:MAG: hypothetical protein WC352_03705 [Candidatus Omnitrophota bacterium]|jgi:hypothetical protein
MNDSLQNYLDIILRERGWSWTVLGIVYLSVAMFLRGLFLRPVTRKARELNRALGNDVKKTYLRQSLLGWIFFFIPLVLLIVMWSRPKIFPLTTNDVLLAFAGTLSFFLSLALHAQAFGIAAIRVLKQTYDRENASGL